MLALKIAIVGTRGIPANYGGFETFAEELSTRLVQKGHNITVYCRSHYFNHYKKIYKGVRLEVLPSVKHKYLDTVVHTLLSVLHLMPRNFDIVLVCNSANALFCILPKIAGKKVILNVDGVERKRKKWNLIGKLFYFVSEHFACAFPDIVVTDAVAIQNYYRTRHGKETVMIPYGADIPYVAPGDIHSRLGIQKGKFYLYVSRLEKENNAHLVIKAFEKIKTDKKLLIVGDAPYNRDYIKQIKNTKDERIIFPGAIYGSGYKELVSNAFCYIHATEVGGTHPALVENMSAGNVIFYLNSPENKEVVGNTAIPLPLYDTEKAVKILQKYENEPERFQHLKEMAKRRAQTLYNWDNVVDKYLMIFKRISVDS